MRLWKFCWDCGRSGFIDGLFLASSKDVEELLGKQIYFGEVLGKHSEIYGTIDEGDIKQIEVDAATIDGLTPHGPTLSGYNPFDYYEEEEEEDCD